ncbi:hypothetical protein EYZ11_001749 [Aspergillus tanneri]|uniref:Uncharacterized protein n=1 Tax=Aspergillus tanneri TaxID=1220188 RepID=A0A4S3JT82_9EURO|nr:hypothetical protein EYZ11_001749 [Aspergillus tanneri]
MPRAWAPAAAAVDIPTAPDFRQAAFRDRNSN